MSGGYWRDLQEVKDAVTALHWAHEGRKTLSEGYSYFLKLGAGRGKSYASRTYDSWRHKTENFLRNKASLESLKTSDLAQILRAKLLEGPQTLESLSLAIDRSEPTVREILEGLRRDGFEVKLQEERAVLDRGLIPSDWKIDLSPYYGESLRLGLISCTHFGSMYFQPRELQTFLQFCKKEQVRVVIHAGDLVDGTGMYKGQEFEQYALGADAQQADVEKNYPDSGLPNLVLGGNHDYSYQKLTGYNIVKKICEAREDLIYVGMISATFFIPESDLEMQLIHKRGGVPYARSYASQRAAQELPLALQKPLLGIGGLHVNDYVYYKGQHVFLTPCFQGQTPYLKGKPLFPEVGGWIIEVVLTDDGKISRCKLEMIPYETSLEPIKRGG